MAAGKFPPPPQAATFFLETSLGTRLAVSFSPHGTVADLKRTVSIEHAVSFPHIGEITVKSFKVKRRGSLYHLSDSMFVKSAFEGIKGTWFLQVDAISLSSVGNKDAKCGTEVDIRNALDSERNAGHLIGDCREKMLPFVKNMSSEGGGLALHDLTSQLENKVPECLLHHPGKCEQIRLQSSTSNYSDRIVGIGLAQHTNIGSKGQKSQCEAKNSICGGKPALGVATVEHADPVRNQSVDTNQESTTGMIIDEGHKDIKEEKENCGSLDAEDNNDFAALINTKQDDRKRCKNLQNNDHLEHNSKSKRHCKREDRSFSEMDANDIASTDVAICTSSKDICKARALLEDTQNQSKEGRITLKKKMMEQSSKSTSKVDLLVASDNHEVNSHTAILDDLVNKSNLTATVEKCDHAECLDEKLMEQQEDLNKGLDKENIHIDAEIMSSGKADDAGIQHKRNCGSPADAQSGVPWKRYDLRDCKKSTGELLTGQSNKSDAVCSELRGSIDNIEEASGENHNDSIEEYNASATVQASNDSTRRDSASPSIPSVKGSKSKRKRTEQADQSSHPLPPDGPDGPSSGTEMCNDESSKNAATPWGVVEENHKEKMKDQTRLLDSIKLATSCAGGAPGHQVIEDSAECAYCEEKKSSCSRNKSYGADVHSETHCSTKEELMKKNSEGPVKDSEDNGNCEEEKSSHERKNSSRNGMHVAESSKKKASSLGEKIVEENLKEELKSKRRCSQNTSSAPWCPVVEDSEDHAHYEKRSSRNRNESSRADMHNDETSTYEAHSLEKVISRENSKEGPNDKLKSSDNIWLATSSVDGASGRYMVKDSAHLQRNNAKISRHQKKKAATTESTNCSQSDQQKSNVLGTEDDQEKLRHTRETLADQSKEKNSFSQLASFDVCNAPSSDDYYICRSKQKATSTDSTEEETWYERKRQRVGVCKVPFSRLKKNSNLFSRLKKNSNLRQLGIAGKPHL